MHEPTSLRNRNLMLKPCRQRPGGGLCLFALCIGLATTAWAWPGHTWETWRDASTWTKPDLRTLQAGRKELVPLLATEADSNARIDEIRAWEHRRKDTGAVIQRILGKPTNLPAAPPPEVEVLGEETLTDHIRRHIRIRCEANDWIPAYVLLPRKLPAPRVAAMICLHQTAASGKDEPCGINGDDDLALALQLVRRGYICIAPDMIGFGERIPDDTQPYHDSIRFYRRHPGWSFIGKMVWDVSRVVDYLETLPYVDSLRIGAIGHSHGAYGAVFAAAFEPRISLAIASCGFNTFRADPTPERWSHMTALIPQLGTYLPDVAAIPFDWHDIFAQIAPRPLYIWYATQDRIFPNTQGLDAVLKDVRTVYGLYGAADDLEWHAFDGPHSFLAPARAQAYTWLDARFAYKGVMPKPERVHTEQPAATSSSTAPLLNCSTALARRAPGATGPDVTSGPASAEVGGRPERQRQGLSVDARTEPAANNPREIIQRIIRRTIGTPPPPPAPSVTVIETTKLPNYERHLIEYNVEPGERVRAYLCVPNTGQRPLPAVLVLHQTAAAGKREAVGLEGDGVYAFGADLAERGYITLSPDSICAGDRIDAYGPFDTRGHYQRHPALSAMGKMLHDAQQALDVLAATDGVDPARLGTIGHSLGAEEALMLAAFDERVCATISSCGFATFAAESNPLRWARDQWFSYMPKLRPIFLTDRQPAWDWPDVIRLLAPRALFLHNTSEDTIFPEAESAHAAAEAVRPTWALYGHADRLVSVLKPGGHTISNATKADIYAWLDCELASATPATSRPADARHSTQTRPHREEH
ncbi:MAG: dienelactone hydrolase family protein [Phycisphaerae bacterium]|nr:dienelactone hydrolase family protein [Phycisphaerae bacterium]